MNRTGFTLIELLIVIAIILILIAIALPNFLEAQIRARLTKARGDMRTIATAMESYFIDWGMYTDDHDPNEGQKGLYQLTTPLTYLPQIPEDPFVTANGLLDSGDEIGWEMGSTGVRPAFLAMGTVTVRGNIHAYALTSHGIDLDDDFSCNDLWPLCSKVNPCPGDGTHGDGWMTYSPTNGTKSNGEIVLVGGEHRNGSYCIDGWNHIRGKYP